MDYVQHTFVLSLAGLRRIELSPQATREANAQARTCLAALGLLIALVSQDRAGYALRSRCHLVPEAGSTAELELVLADGTTESFSLGYETAVSLLEAAVQAASKEARWREVEVVLEPQAKLVELVRRSREAALAGEDSESDVALRSRATRCSSRLIGGSVDLRALGVAEVYAARRVANGKFMNVTRAMPRTSA